MTIMNNEKSKISTIRLIELLAPIISSREIINEVLEDKINRQNSFEVVLDFNKIEFISRSAAHELLKLKERFENMESNTKEITFTNMESVVAEMIRTVAANRAYPLSEEETFKAEKVDILELA